MRYAVIENNTVTNIIEASGPNVLPGVTLIEALPTTIIGDVLVLGKLPPPTPKPQPDPAVVLAESKAEALTRIDAAAEAERAKYLTPGAGQAMVYQQKQAEAHAWQANPNGTYPHLTAEIGITGATLEEVAQTVLAMEAGWTQVSSAIEATRLAAKAVVRTCTTPAEVEQTVTGITWPQIKESTHA